MKSLHISVAPEAIFHLGPLTVTNSLLTSIIVMLVLIFISLKATDVKNHKTKTKISSFVEMVVEGFYGFFKGILGEAIDKLFPLLFTFFAFIIVSNWIGLFPGVGPIGIWEEGRDGKVLVPLLRGPNADLNTTISLAIISVVVTQIMSIKALGIAGYLKRFFNIRNPINLVVGILELISEVSKLISFSFRLFGNIFAGEVLLAVMTFLVPVLVPVPFLGLEVFVGFIQALVFTMLTSIFIVVATEHHEGG
ncbi:ATP synthase F0 subunit A [Candidatus Woesebacteria bacterium RIFCSPLOWO2_01_FULL_39_21]|uniref:ATP synthase subunit a n=1 Tax=Candidatus Woesebacteria bacterium RIFCSPLOWO2_01_FULL_39_21 TaxID=1802519 RepID=A0A1F8BKX7_9BACT|nr:MAG: ATP synthase F0 subunit A [Candidatus Woesebacteria bacterium RIFCSPLOWO2_01_FULL_39_21]